MDWTDNYLPNKSQWLNIVNILNEIYKQDFNSLLVEVVKINDLHKTTRCNRYIIDQMLKIISKFKDSVNFPKNDSYETFDYKCVTKKFNNYYVPVITEDTKVIDTKITNEEFKKAIDYLKTIIIRIK